MARSGFALFPLILTAGAIVLLFFIILAGVQDATPLNQTYFLEVALNKFKNATSSPTGNGHYTLWGVCGVDSNGNNVNCPKPSPAYPFDPVSNFGTSGVPQAVIDHSTFFYYMSRFSFAFYLIAVTFSVVAFVTGLLALCSRLGGAISSIFAFLALFFAAAAASLTTAYVVTARNLLNDNGITASIGVKALGFAWGAVGALLLASFSYCCVACGRRKSSNKEDFATTPTSTRSRFWKRSNKTPFDSEHTANGSY